MDVAVDEPRHGEPALEIDDPGGFDLVFFDLYRRTDTHDTAALYGYCLGPGLRGILCVDLSVGQYGAGNGSREESVACA